MLSMPQLLSRSQFSNKSHQLSCLPGEPEEDLTFVKAMPL